MYKTFLYIIFFSIAIFSKQNIYAQQNLVPNPSFEEYDTCPTFASLYGALQIQHCLQWYSPTKGTSDYFNVCCDNHSCVHVPDNCFGFQHPYDGNGYLGLFTYLIRKNDSNDHYREYVQTNLNTSLKQGEEYYFEFHISRAEYYYIAIDRSGALFTSYPISRNDFQPIIAKPQIENPRHQIIKDTVGWIKISGTFVAEGGECYLTIGNFYTPEETDVYIYDQANGHEDYAYYYIDGIILREVDSWIDIPNVFTPNGDGYNDMFLVKSKSLDYFKGEIFNRWGVKLFEWHNPRQGWDGTYKGNDCPVGVYYYIINAKGAEGKEYHLQGTIQLLK